MAGKEALLKRAREVAQAHTGVASLTHKKISSDWRDFFDDKRSVHVAERGCTFNVYLAGTSGPVVFCVHGGGYTGLTFALVAAELKAEYRVVAFDMRHHGETTCESSDMDFSRETLSGDVSAVWQALFADDKPATVLVGHSVGGALAVWAAQQGTISALEGLIVIDVVEGTAISSLPRMTAILNKRPESFPSPAAAIDWVLEQDMSKSRRAAAISMPSQLIERGGAWHWRTPLLASEPAWASWYEGLSAGFLAVPVPKVLVLAGADRLDKPLTIAQMQGKFQMVLVPASGHAVQEDEPEEAAETIRTFLRRFRVGQPPLVFPRATPGLAPVLPQAAGVLHEPRRA